MRPWSFYLDEASEVIRARLANRTVLTRLERTGGPDKERVLYQEAAAFLAGPEHEWRQHTVDCRGRSPAQVVAAILNHLNIPHITAA